ncbi:MAG: IclR family transcriptional regulator [Rhizobiaceae bacterium]|nr:IclR family transcriptional regulator [Rhizobiaceae bacterium]
MTKPIVSDGTVGKALSVLDQVAAFERPVRFTEILKVSEHPKATLYRLLNTLTRQQMLAYDSEKQTYWLGLKLVRLANSAWSQSSLARIAGPAILQLSEGIDETVHLAQMDAGQVLFVDKIRRAGNSDTLARVGLIAPAHCTGVGKAILAHLPSNRLEHALDQQNFFRFTPNTCGSRKELMTELETVKRAGIAFDREEHELGVISIAAPILRQNGRPLGALSIASSTSRHCLDSISQFRSKLLETAQKIAREAEVWNFPQTS